MQSGGVFWQTLPMPNDPAQARIAADRSQSPPVPAKIEDGTAAKHDSDRRREIGGPSGPEPTRYGDWERAGRCIDF
jgi:hypothetical protein